MFSTLLADPTAEMAVRAFNENAMSIMRPMLTALLIALTFGFLAFCLNWLFQLNRYGRYVIVGTMGGAANMLLYLVTSPIIHNMPSIGTAQSVPLQACVVFVMSAAGSVIGWYYYNEDPRYLGRDEEQEILQHPLNHRPGHDFEEHEEHVH